MDWTLCIICQQKTPEALKCPLNAWGRGDKSKVYASFLTNVSEFKQLNKLPMLLNFEEDMEEKKKNKKIQLTM